MVISSSSSLMYFEFLLKRNVSKKSIFHCCNLFRSLSNVIVFQLVIVIRFLYSCLQFLLKLPLADPVWLIFQIYILQLYWKLTPPWKFPWKLSSFFHKNFFLTATVSKDFFQIVMFYSTKYLRKSNFIWFNGQEIEDQSF